MATFFGAAAQGGLHEGMVGAQLLQGLAQHPAQAGLVQTHLHGRGFSSRSRVAFRLPSLHHSGRRWAQGLASSSRMRTR
ncbi:MAG: hypothetical protein U0P46_09600 [Holophagaceae bacterium]